MPLPQRPFGFDDRYGVEQPAAPKKISLREIFNKFAADAMRDFPKLRDSFMLIDGESGVAIGNVDPDKLNIAPQELATIIATQAYSRSPTGGIADTHLVSEELNPYVIKEGAVYAIRFNDYMDVSGNAEKDILFALHHELGHAVVPQYKKYPAIFDMHLYMAMVGAGKKGLIVTLAAQGVSKQNALALGRRFMNEIKPGKNPS